MFLWLKPQAMLFEISRFSTKSRWDGIFIDIILSYATEPYRGEIYVTPLELRFQIVHFGSINISLLWSFFVSISNIARGFNHGNVIKKQSVSNPMFLWLKPQAMFI